MGNVKSMSFCEKLSVSFELGTSVGALDLLPVTVYAANGFDNVAKARQALAKALTNASNCDSSGSNEAISNVNKANEHFAQVFSTLNGVIANQTNDAGQLRILTGNLSEITTHFRDFGDALNSLSKYIQTLADNINTENFYGYNINVSIEDIMNSTSGFIQVFNNLEDPSKLLLKLVSLITGFTNSESNLAVSLEAESKASSAAEKRCNVSTGTPERLNSYAKLVKVVKENLQL